MQMIFVHVCPRILRGSLQQYMEHCGSSSDMLATPALVSSDQQAGDGIVLKQVENGRFLVQIASL